ncbi:MAG: hypothetical protein QXZ48_07480 [Zestosphaera sp.]
MGKARRLTTGSVFRYLYKQARFLGLPAEVVQTFAQIEVIIRTGVWSGRMRKYNEIRNAVIGILREHGVRRHLYGAYLAFAQKLYKAKERGATKEELDAIRSQFSDLPADILGRIEALVMSA